LLSKINYYSLHTDFDLKKAKVNVPTLELYKYFLTQGSKLENIEQLTKGTLGLSYLAKINGTPIFLKTHIDTIESRENILKEIAIYKNYYSSTLNFININIKSNKKKEIQSWLCMNILHQNFNTIQPELVLNIIDNFPHINIIQKSELQFLLHNFDLLICEGFKALALLKDKKYISKDNVSIITKLLKKIEYSYEYFEMVLCHGDLGPQNLMQYDNQYIAIDWEDAFYGPKGYDYLYWLTFFNNRRFYNKATLERSGYDIKLSVALMCLIILIK
jgi:thiamine kinase-like enzyme